MHALKFQTDKLIFNVFCGAYDPCAQLQMSTMDSERCWGQSFHHEEHDCGPDSGVVLPAVYSLDPAQVRPNFGDVIYHPPL